MSDLTDAERESSRTDTPHLGGHAPVSEPSDDEEDGYDVSFGSDDEDDPEQFDPYGVPVENVDVHFITKVEGVENLGEAFETASLNLITHGIGSYFVLLTDRDSGREWVAHGGLVGNVGDDDVLVTDPQGVSAAPRRTEDVNLPD